MNVDDDRAIALISLNFLTGFLDPTRPMAAFVQDVDHDTSPTC